MIKLLAGTKKIMGDKYAAFCKTMVDAADNNALPLGMQVDNTFGLSFQDVEDFCKDFENDTDLVLVAHMFVCDECKRLHVMFEADYPDDDDTTYIQ